MLLWWLLPCAAGAYNRTLTPFGFQSEERTLWQAPEVYSKMSPFQWVPVLLVTALSLTALLSSPAEPSWQHMMCSGPGHSMCS